MAPVSAPCAAATACSGDRAHLVSALLQSEAAPHQHACLAVLAEHLVVCGRPQGSAPACKRGRAAARPRVAPGARAAALPTMAASSP